MKAQPSHRTVGSESGIDAGAAFERERLLHELAVHQAELEAQNEELRRARGEIETGLERYTQFFDFAPIGYACLSDKGKILELNHVGARLFGVPRALAVGAAFRNFVSVDDESTVSSLVRSVLADDLARSCEVRIRSGKSSVAARVTVTCLKGVPGQVLVAFEDVTAQKQAEETRQRELALREANRRKDEFLAVLSHELRTPLSVLLIHSQLLQRDHVDHGRVRHSARLMERAARAQRRLIDELLDLSRIVTGKLRLKLDVVDLGTTLRAVVDAMSEEAAKQGVSLSLRIESVATTVMADAARIQLAISNLVGNALKFTPAGGEVTVTLSARGGWSTIEVRDTGVGIDPGFLPHVFERFSQADQSTTRSKTGLGLGLAIAHSIVQAHGGQLAATSEGNGRGSSFTLMLPIADGPPLACRVEPGSEDSISLEGARLLVVDDDAGTRETVTEVLVGAGAVVRGAGSAREAMVELDEFDPDALICDIAMPEEDGYSLLRRIRERDRLRGRKMPALALTAQASEQDRVRSRTAGFDEHLAKPVEIEQLLGAVSKLL